MPRFPTVSFYFYASDRLPPTAPKVKNSYTKNHDQYLQETPLSQDPRPFLIC